MEKKRNVHILNKIYIITTCFAGPLTLKRGRGDLSIENFKNSKILTLITSMIVPKAVSKLIKSDRHAESADL